MSLIWGVVLQSTHTLTMEDKQRHALDAAFKLKPIDLAVTE